MSARPWYKRFPSDFISGTISLTLEEAGAYSYIIDLIHDRGGPIPDDSQWIARVCGCSTRKWNTIRGRLIQAGKISEKDGQILSFRAVKDAENGAKEARKLSENGAKGAEKTNEKKTTSQQNNDLTEKWPDKITRHTRSQKPEAREEREPSGSPKKKPPDEKPKRGFRLADDWVLPNEGVAWALKAGMSLLTIEREAAKFKNYWLAKSGQGGVKLDWPATWRNWVFNSQDWARPQKTTGADELSDAFADMDAQVLGGLR